MDELYILCQVDGNPNSIKSMLSITEQQDTCLGSSDCECAGSVFTFADRVQEIMPRPQPAHRLPAVEIEDQFLYDTTEETPTDEGDEGELSLSMYHALTFISVAISLLAILLIVIVIVCYKAKQLKDADIDEAANKSVENAEDDSRRQQRPDLILQDQEAIADYEAANQTSNMKLMQAQKLAQEIRAQGN